ncbi:Exodeoxyribonuclease III [Aphelenchoides fujianensis]|nr:Exodeoxyribonuclease III [Aphelenchoides fujianensis]
MAAGEAAGAARQQFETICFLDLETTGLIGISELLSAQAPGRWLPGEKRDLAHVFQLFADKIDDNREVVLPRITEFAMVSLPRALYVDGIERVASKHSQATPGATDLFVHVACSSYVRQINPDLTEAEWDAYEQRQQQCDGMHLRKLDLLPQPKFPRVWPEIRAYLESLQPPVVIVAHNGIRFDYRVLLAELQRLESTDEQRFPSAIFFADSYVASLDLEKRYHKEVEGAMGLVDWKLITELAVSKLDHERAAQRKAAEQLAEVRRAEAEAGGDRRPIIDSGEMYYEEELTDSEKGARILQRPPSRVRQATPPPNEANAPPAAVGCQSAPGRLSGKRPAADFEAANPLKFLRTDLWSPAKRRRLSPAYFQRSEEGDWKFARGTANQHFFTRGHFKLGTLYNEIFNGEFAAHHAYDDCVAMMRVCLAYGHDGLEYLDTRAVRLPSYTRLEAPTAAAKEQHPERVKQPPVESPPKQAVERREAANEDDDDIQWID